MADKETALSIVLRTVDKATATIRAVNKRLDEITKPTREFGKALSELGEKSGLNAVMDGFHGVGGAVSDLIGKVAMVGGAVAVAVYGLVSLVDQFEQLGKISQRVGVEADFLAGMRYAATKTGATVEQLDQGIQTFAQNLGQAKAGTGRMVKFLGTVSPALLHQLQAAHSTQEALGLLADAMAKLGDRSKLLALAQKTLGDSALAPLFHEGSKGIMEQMAAYAALAGPQQDAVDGATKAGDALKDLNAATDGVKAALVTGLSPALTEIVDKITAWLVGHRDDIGRWAKEIGDKLPGAAQELVTWIGKAYDKVTAFVDTMGGMKNVAIAVAAVIAGPLISSIVSLGIALLASPVGWFMLAVAGLASAALALGIADPEQQRKGAKINAAMEGIDLDQYAPDGAPAADSDSSAKAAVAAALQKGMTDAIAKNARSTMAARLPTAGDAVPIASTVAAAAATPGPPQQAKIQVDFANVPKGARVTADPRNTASVDLSVGYQMGGS